MSLIEHAKRELDLLGMTEDSDEINVALREDILDVIRVFSMQGHSGTSAAYAIACLTKLLRFEPIAPLTGADDEWTDVDGRGLQQNVRCSRVFRHADGSAYDTNGRVFCTPSGFCYTGRDSWTEVTFPYTPTTEYVDVPE